MELRVIPYTSNSAYSNMAIDHALLESVAEGVPYMVLRLYSWKPNAVSIGRFQSMEKEVDVEKCRSMGIDMVRRMTGGGTAYHNNEDEISYSLIAREHEMPKGIRKCYLYAASMVKDALGNLGITAEYSPLNDVVVDGKIISETMQTRKEGAVLLHGNIFYNADVRKMLTVLNTGETEITDSMVKSASSKITDVKTNSHASMDELKEATFNSFTRCRAWKESKLTKEEKERSIELEENVYKNKEWNFNR